MLRENVGRLFIIVAGAGGLVLLMFVVLPMLNEPAPPMTQDEIVAEVLGSGGRAEETNGEAAADGVMPVPSPLVGIRNDGEEVAVIFLATESDTDGAPVTTEESVVQESGLPQILSEQDVAEAREALLGEESEPVIPVEADSLEASGEGEAVAVVVPEPVVPVEREASGEGEAAVVVVPEPVPPVGQDLVAALITPAVSEAALPLNAEAEETRQDAAEEELEAMVRAMVRTMILETQGGGGGDAPRVVERLADRRGEFDMPEWLDSRSQREVSHPSGGVPERTAAEAVQAGSPDPGLPPRTGVTVAGTLRGVMGYRMPLIGRQEVPDQIVSGVLIPAHTTFVILKEGSWELVDVTPEEVQVLVDADARRKAPAPEVEPARRGWNLLRMFRKRETPATVEKGVEQRKR